MGCCLTKRSRTRNKGLNETLLNGEGSSEGHVRMNPARNNRSDNGYSPVTPSSEDSRGGFDRVNSTGVGLTRRISTGAHIEGLDNGVGVKKKKTRKVVGKSLLLLPSIKSLKKVGWLEKRGHMVRPIAATYLL